MNHGIERREDIRNCEHSTPCDAIALREQDLKYVRVVIREPKKNKHC